MLIHYFSVDFALSKSIVLRGCTLLWFNIALDTDWSLTLGTCYFLLLNFGAKCTQLFKIIYAYFHDHLTLRYWCCSIMTLLSLFLVEISGIWLSISCLIHYLLRHWDQKRSDLFLLLWLLCLYLTLLTTAYAQIITSFILLLLFRRSGSIQSWYFTGWGSS